MTKILMEDYFKIDRDIHRLHAYWLSDILQYKKNTSIIVDYLVLLLC